MNSTTSMSSPRTSSTPATSAHVVCDLAPWLRTAGLTRGIIPTVFQSNEAIRTRNRNSASGSQVEAKSFTAWNQCPTISASHRQRGGHPLAEGCGRLLGGRRSHALLAPRRHTGGRSGLVDAARRVLHERDAAAPAQERAHGRVVADLGRDAAEGGLVRGASVGD